MIIGLQVRHYKAYKNVKFIPIGNEHNFVAFAGENGVGKSSILEALNTFLNEADWLLTKEQKHYDSYICPIFLIPKEKVSRLKNDFDIISNFFWDLEKKDKTDEFFTIRDSLNIETKDTHYLLYLGEGLDKNWNRKLKIPFGKTIEEPFNSCLGVNFSEKNFLKELKDLYSYVYVPVEINSEKFTKIETKEMQKIFNKEIKNEIKKSIKQSSIDSINTNLDSFVKDLEKKLDGKYFYDTGDTGTKKLTPTSLLETVLEMYFKKRVLMKGQRSEIKSSKKMSELSAGEKREALINLIYVFLKESEDRGSMVLIGIDEPENSLHTAICYKQFEKLKKISKDSQVFITTHWYGFLPIIDKGIVHFLKNTIKDNQEVFIDFFDKVDLYLYPYKTKKIPDDFILKSTNDLVQSIFHSVKAEEPYNWLICEGTSDQIYLEYFLKKEIKEKNLQIIPVGGIDLVKKFYKYLLLPVSENFKNQNCGRIFCLTDTDANTKKKDINLEQDVVNTIKNNLVIKRLASNIDNSTSLIQFELEEKQESIGIEQSLNPNIFIKTLESFNVEYEFLKCDIQNINGNTTKNNLRNWNIDSYFIDGKVKNNFAKKYVEIMEEGDSDDFVPGWINEIKEFFNS